MESFLTDTVKGLLAVIRSGDTSALPILADALEDAGYTDRRALGWPGQTVLTRLRAGEHTCVFSRYLTAGERAELAPIGLSGAKGIVLQTDSGYSLYSDAYHDGQYNPTAAGPDEAVSCSGIGWACDYPLSEFVTRRTAEIGTAEEARQKRTADDLLSDPAAVAVLDDLIDTGRAYSHRSDALARRPVVRAARARRLAAR